MTYEYSYNGEQSRLFASVCVCVSVSVFLLSFSLKWAIIHLGQYLYLYYLCWSIVYIDCDIIYLFEAIFRF